MTRSPLLLLLLTACAETGKPDLGGDTAADPGTDSGPAEDTGPPDTGPAEDTGAGDCAVDLPPEGTAATDPACAGEVAPPADPWAVTLEQRLVDSFPRSTPVVGHLDDDDGDGVAGHGDVAEIVAIDRFDGSFGASMVVYDGRGHRRFKTNYGFNSEVDPLVGDLDGDGVGEVVAAMHGYTSVPLVALDVTGAELWRSDTLELVCLNDDHECPTSAADLDGDGVAEVIVDQWILDGATGDVEAQLVLDPADRYWMARSPVAADLDGDGAVEVVMGDRAFAADGTLLWEAYDAAARSAYPALVQLDADPEAEIALSRDKELLLLEHDGTTIRTVALPGAARMGYAGPPCVGDLDGVGASEIVVPSMGSVDAFAADGTLLWSGYALNAAEGGKLGCATFDFDADGADEVAFGDPAGLRIFDGRTGDVHWNTTDYDGGPLLEGPVVADVDGDGHAELLASSTGTTYNAYNWTGLQVYGHDGDGWPATGSVWGTHDFAVTTQTADGGFPSTPPTPWLDHGRFRGQAIRGALGDGADLAVGVADVCAVCEDGGAGHVAVVVANEGTAAADATVTLEAVDGAGNRRTLDEAAVSAVAAGTTAAGVELSWDVGALVPGEALEIAVSGGACDDGDDRVAVADPCAR